jgi:hypothetical protein
MSAAHLLSGGAVYVGLKAVSMLGKNFEIWPTFIASCPPDQGVSPEVSQGGRRKEGEQRCCF